MELFAASPEEAFGLLYIAMIWITVGGLGVGWNWNW